MRLKYVLICAIVGWTVVATQYLPQQSPGGHCDPFMCPLHCPNGYAVGPTGCKVCECLMSSQSQTSHNTQDSYAAPLNPGGDPMHQGGAMVDEANWFDLPVSSSFDVPCVPGTTCGLSCPGGYRATKSGCQVCLCAPPQETTTTVQPYVYTNPCASAPTTCDQPCSGVGYATGTGGCHYCACASPTQVPNTTTSTEAAATSRAPAAAASAAECIFRMTQCQLKCPTGFLTDNIMCQMCVCKDVIYAMAHIPLDRQPMVKLTNPCIQQYETCRIVCSSGYRTGVRGCQYCACRN